MHSDHDVSALNLGSERGTDASLAHLALALSDEMEYGIIVRDGQGALHFASRPAIRERASQRLLQHGGGVLPRASGAGGGAGAGERLVDGGRAALPTTGRRQGAANEVKLSTVRTQIWSIRAEFDTRSIQGLLLLVAPGAPVLAPCDWPARPPLRHRRRRCWRRRERRAQLLFPIQPKERDHEQIR